MKSTKASLHSFVRPCFKIRTEKTTKKLAQWKTFLMLMCEALGSVSVLEKTWKSEVERDGRAPCVSMFCGVSTGHYLS